MNRHLIRLMAMAPAMLACVFLNSCAVMAVRTGVKAARKIEENAANRSTNAPPENAGQENQPGLLHRPGLLRH